MNILDIAQNSIKARADLIQIDILKSTYNSRLSITICDNGSGMTEQQVLHVIDPFYTTRTTRKVGLGVPFFKMSAEMTGGNFLITSVVDVGTTIVAVYDYSHIDMMPIGDMAATMMSLVSVNPLIDFVYRYKFDDREFCMDTREIKTLLEGVPINSNEVLLFIKDFIEENTASTNEQKID